MVVYGLDNIYTMSVDNVGAKAHNLSVCARTFRADKDVMFAKAIAITSDHFLAQAEETDITTDLKLVEICAIIDNYFEQHSVIIRSSAVDEDSKFFSGAGQYDSFLNLSSDSEKINALQLVLESSRNENVKLYNLINNSQLNSQSDDRTVPILVQQMIATTLSGVLYTRHPLNYSDDIVLEASAQGAKVASGEISSQTLYFKRNNQISEQNPLQHKVFPKLIEKLIEVALTLESVFGCPLDIEWGITANDELYIFQARPMFFSVIAPFNAKCKLAHFDYSNSGNPISNGVAIGRFNSKRFFASKVPVPASKISVIADSNAIIIMEGGLLSHFSSIMREFGIVSAIIKDIPSSNLEDYYVLNGFTGELFLFDNLDVIDKQIFMWEAFYRFVIHPNKNLLLLQGIRTAHLETKYEAVIIGDSVRRVLTKLNELCVPFCDVLQKSTTYDLQDNSFAGKLIIRRQETNEYIRLQIKRVEPLPNYRRDISILIDFMSVANFEEFMSELPLKVTGFQERKLRRYSFDDCNLNVITWPGADPYIGIEFQQEEAFTRICELLGLEQSSFTSINGKQIFDLLNLKLDSLSFETLLE